MQSQEGGSEIGEKKQPVNSVFVCKNPTGIRRKLDINPNPEPQSQCKILVSEYCQKGQGSWGIPQLPFVKGSLKQGTNSPVLPARPRLCHLQKPSGRGMQRLADGNRPYQTIMPRAEETQALTATSASITSPVFQTIPVCLFLYVLAFLADFYADFDEGQGVSCPLLCTILF